MSERPPRDESGRVPMDDNARLRDGLRMIVRDVVGAVGVLYGHALPDYLAERLADLPEHDLDRLEHLILLKAGYVDEDEMGERYGFGVCRRGDCVEPCGPNGGCIR